MGHSPEIFVALAWSISSFIGLCFQASGLIDAIMDIKSLNESGKNGARLLVGKSHRRDESVRCAVHLLFLSVGIIALCFPQQHRQPTRVGEYGSLAIILVNALLVLNAILSRRARSAINRCIDELEGVESR